MVFFATFSESIFISFKLFFQFTLFFVLFSPSLLRFDEKQWNGSEGICLSGAKNFENDVRQKKVKLAWPFVLIVAIVKSVRVAIW